MEAHQLGFVLSPSRTGTVFLAQSLKAQFPQVHCVHEPPPARLEAVLGNMRNELGLGHALVRALFLTARRRRLARVPAHHQYVEINPMLCQVTDLLGTLQTPLHVVHMVREPASWAESITSFKASGYRRYIIDHVPFALPYPCPRPQNWSRLDASERALWRWRFCNEQILRLKPLCHRYALVRYEDLFAAEPDRREAALRTVLDVLEIPTNGDFTWFTISERVNAAPAAPGSRRRPPESTVRDICGDLIQQFGY